jgi:transcription termination factor Rho
MGVLEVHADGFGFLRSAATSFLPGADDIYVSQSQIRRFKLRTGDLVIGNTRAAKEGERYTALLRVDAVNGEQPGGDPPSFDALTAIYPDERFDFSGDPVLRIVDFAAPLGLGQRGILVAPTRARPGDLLRRLANHLLKSDDLHVTVLLLAERPEEIHDWRETSKAEIIATPFDEPPARHVQVADIAFERARRMVERGDDTVLLVDSLSRLLRAVMSDAAPAGRDLSVVDGNALHRIRRWLGAARALEEGGSLTVVALVGEDGKADDVLLEDLRGVVNWELRLSRRLAELGVDPPIDVRRSGVLRADLLVTDAAEAARRAQLASRGTGDEVADAELLRSLSAVVA